jgi:hypothetical protein
MPNITGPSITITGHQYILNVYSDGATSYPSGKANNGGTVTQIGTSNAFYYMPNSAGVEQITFTTKNDVATSQEGVFTTTANANKSPKVDLLAVAAGSSASYPLPVTDDDGDTVTWSLGTTGGTFVTSSGGSATIKDNELILDASKVTTNGDFTLTGLVSTESGNGIPSGKNISLPHTLQIRVGAMAVMPDGSIDTDLTNRLRAIKGIPHIIQFVASSPFPTDKIVTWGTNDGVDKLSSGPAPQHVWVSTLAQPTPPAGTPIFTALQNTYPDPKDQVRPTGEMWYVADSDTPTGGQVLMGIRAVFDSGVIAYRNFKIDIDINHPPEIVEADYTDFVFNKEVPVTFKTDRFWQTTPMAYTTASKGIVFKGQSDGSKDISYEVDLSNVVINDVDIVLGDKMDVKLTGIRLGSATGTNNVLTQFGFPAAGAQVPVTYHESTGTQIARLGKLTFNVPTDDVLSTFNKLYFTFTVNDQANKAEADTRKFSVAINAAKNTGPVISENDVPNSHGDKLVAEHGWARMQPCGGEYTGWDITHAGTGTGDGEDYFVIKDGIGSNVYLQINQNVADRNKVKLTNTTPLVAEGGKWEFEWNPSTDWNRKPYNFTIQAWNEYGAASEEFEMKGVVWGPVQGKPVTKNFYLYEDVVAYPANFSTFASIVLNPYFDENTPKYTNEYGWDSGGHWNYGYDPYDYSIWKVIAVPPGHYLVSAAATDTVGKNTIAPVVGPAVNATRVNDPASASKQVTGRYAYAYTDSDDPDLTTYTGLGALTGIVDTSFSPSVNAVTGGDPGYYNEDQAPILLTNAKYQALVDGELNKVTASSYFQAQMTSVGAGDLVDSGAIQFVIKGANQKAFFAVTEGAVSAVDPYPASVYPATLGWTSALGFAEAGTIDADGGYSYNQIKFSLANIFAYQVKAEDQALLAAMQKRTVNPGVGGGYGANQPNYWIARRTAFIPSLPLLGDSNTTGANSTFAYTENGPVFTAKVERDKFSQWLPRISGSAAITPASVKDTLQVLTYPAGTALGPVENIYGVPTLVEFGGLYNYAATAFGTRSAANALTADTVDLGEITIPLPQDGSWYGTKDPVVHYIASYQDAKFVPGSMGVITKSTGPVTFDIEPILNLKITTKAYNDTGAAGTWVKTVADASDPISATANATTPFYTYYGTTRNAAIFQNDGKEFGQVWLSWTKPTKPFSGTIIEFFDIDGLDAATGYTTAPAYKVFVGPEVTQFPIPEAWVHDMVTNYHGGANIVIRLRAVKYGDGSVINPVIDFNQTPFKQALPATWIDTISSVVSFGSITYPVHVADTWDKAGYTGHSTGTLTAAIDIATGTITAVTAGDIGFTFEETSYSSANPPTSGFTYTWATNPTSIGTIATDYTGTAASQVTLSGTTLNPSISINNAGNQWDTLALPIDGQITATLNVAANVTGTPYTSTVPVTINLKAADYTWTQDIPINVTSTHTAALTALSTAMSPTPTLTFNVTGSDINQGNALDAAKGNLSAAWTLGSPLVANGTNYTGTATIADVTLGASTNFTLPTITMSGVAWDDCKGLDSVVVPLVLTLEGPGAGTLTSIANVNVTVRPVWTSATVITLKGATTANVAGTLLDGTTSLSAAGGTWNPATLTLGAFDELPFTFTAAGTTVTDQNNVTVAWTISDQTVTDDDSGKIIATDDITISGGSLTAAPTVSFAGTTSGSGTNGDWSAAGEITFNLNCEITYTGSTGEQTATFTIAVTINNT